MPIRPIPSALVPLLVAAFPGAAFAAGEPPPAVSFAGFVDTSLVIPVTGYPPGQRGVTLGLDQVELDVVATPAAGVTVRADLNWFPALALTGFDDVVEQGYLRVDHVSGLFLQAGKANAPFGVELPDPVDAFQFSNGLLFTYATPTNLTGLVGGYAAEHVEALLIVSNDWDTPTTPGGAAAGGRFAYRFDGGSSVGVSALYGPFTADDPRLLIDADVTVVLGDLTLWAEGNLGRVGGAQTAGILLKGNYAIGDHSATLRASYLSADEGVGDFGRHDLELTGAWNLPVATGVAGVVELRVDLPDVGDPRFTAAFELTGHFE